jgi:trans-aconitate methyltransferase
MTDRQSPPYPAEVFDVLESLLEEPARVLDLAAGDGALARPLIARGRVASIDAVDTSADLIIGAQGLPGGSHPDLHWTIGSVTTAPLNPPYGLVTAGPRLYWLPWKPTLTRLAELLAPHALLAIVEHGHHRGPLPIADELAARGLFHKHGEHRTLPIPQSLDTAATIVWGRPTA